MLSELKVIRSFLLSKILDKGAYDIKLFLV